MKAPEPRSRICPLCGQVYNGHPALSRTDGKTMICPDCGTREALRSIGVSDEEGEKIVSIIHRKVDDQRDAGPMSGIAKA